MVTYIKESLMQCQSWTCDMNQQTDYVILHQKEEVEVVHLQ